MSIEARSEYMDQLCWSVTTLHRGDDFELVQGDPELVLGVSADDFAVGGLAGRLVGENPKPCAWREACESSQYMIRRSSGEVQWVESRSLLTGSGAIAVSTRTSGPATSLAQLTTLGRVALAGSLLGPLAHEVNNVVQGLSAASFLLEDLVTHGDPVSPTFVKDVNGVVDDLTEIGSTLQSFARQGVTPPEPIAPFALVGNCADLLRKTGKFATVGLTLHCEGEIPSLHWSKGELEYVVLALLCNAAEAARKSKEEHTVRVELSSSAQNVVLDIYDSGSGFNYAESMRPFHSGGPAYRSLGLGLTIASAVLASRSGSIQADSTPQGGRVRVLLAIDSQ